MTHLNSTATEVSTLEVHVSEFQRESGELDKAIQQVFDTAQELSKRLQPILSQYPQPPREDSTNPEEALSDLGSKLRANRRAVEGIYVTLCEIINRLAI